MADLALSQSRRNLGSDEFHVWPGLTCSATDQVASRDGSSGQVFEMRRQGSTTIEQVVKDRHNRLMRIRRRESRKRREPILDARARQAAITRRLILVAAALAGATAAMVVLRWRYLATLIWPDG
jgi:hypothetical protein